MTKEEMKQRYIYIIDPVRATTYLPVLADFLEELANWKPHKLDLGIWASSKNIGLEKKDCNTAACAAGWASYLFRRDGLRLRRGANPKFLEVAYRNSRGFNACERFFGISAEAATYLFGPGPIFVSGAEVVTRIRTFLRDANIHEPLEIAT